MPDIQPLNGQKVTLFKDVSIGATTFQTNGKLQKTSSGSGIIGKQFVAFTGSISTDELIFIDQTAEPKLIEDRSAEGKGNVYEYTGQKFGIESDDSTIPPTLAADAFVSTHKIGDEVKIVVAAEYFTALLAAFVAGSAKTIETGAGQGVSDLLKGLVGDYMGIVVSDYSGTVAGTVLATSTTPHLYDTGDVVTVFESTDYNGDKSITVVDEYTFYWTDAYTSDQSAKCSDGKFYLYQPGKTVFSAINDEVLVKDDEYSLPTFGTLLPGFSGLIPGDIVYTDYVANPTTGLTAALAAAGAGNVDDGNHDYKVTYVTSQGETAGSAASASVTVADKTVDGQVSLAGIPVSPNANVTARKIYRRFNGAGDYKLVATISDNTTTTYTDNLANASLGAVIPTENGNYGMITQMLTSTAKPIGVAEKSDSVRILSYAPQNVVFEDGSTGIKWVNVTDPSKGVIQDLSGITSGKTLTLKWTDDGLAIFDGTTETAFAKASDVVNPIISTYPNAIDSGVVSGDLGKYVYIDETAEQTVSTSEYSFGKASSYEKAENSIIGNGVAMTTMKMLFSKYGTPTDSMTVRIETDNAGEPSGTLADANATFDITGASLTTALVLKTITFAGSFTLTLGDKYHIVLTRTGSLSDTHYFKVGYQAEKSFFSLSRLAGGTWTNDATTRAFFSEADGIYTEVLSYCDKDDDEKIDWFGSLRAIADFGALTSVKISGVDGNHAGLTIGDRYYIGEDGDIVKTSSLPLYASPGVAISTTEIMIQKHPRGYVDIGISARTEDTASTRGVSMKHKLGRTPENIDIYSVLEYKNLSTPANNYNTSTLGRNGGASVSVRTGASPATTMVSTPTSFTSSITQSTGGGTYYLETIVVSGITYDSENISWTETRTIGVPGPIPGTAYATASLTLTLS